MSDLDESTWILRLKTMISKLLLNIIDEEDLSYYISAEAMKIWTIAFTSETYSPSENNEELEFLGDAVLEFVFPKYLMQRFPNARKNELTVLKTRYMSKMEQGKLGYEMGFSNKKGTKPHLIRTKGIELISINLVTDAFESFFGALDTISDNIRKGLGYINCYNMIVHLFKNKEITDAQRDAKTQIEQLFSRFTLPVPLTRSDQGKEIQITLNPRASDLLSNRKIPNLIAESNDKNNAYKQAIEELQKLGIVDEIDLKQSNKKENIQIFEVVLTNKHLDFLRDYGVQLTNNVIGRGEASTKDGAEKKAYSNALNFLSNIVTDDIPNGITTEWAETQKLLTDISHPEVKKYVEPAARKLRSKGYNSFKFVTPAKTSEKKNALIQLLGIKPNGEKIVLATTLVDQKDRKQGNIIARATLLENFINEK